MINARGHCHLYTIVCVIKVFAKETFMVARRWNICAAVAFLTKIRINQNLEFLEENTKSLMERICVRIVLLNMKKDRLSVRMWLGLEQAVLRGGGIWIPLIMGITKVSLRETLVTARRQDDSVISGVACNLALPHIEI